MTFTKTIELGPSKNVGTKAKPKFEYVEPKMSVEMSILTAAESFQADNYIGSSESERLAYKTYAICCVRKVNGKPVNPLANEIEFEVTRDLFTLGQLGRLVSSFVQLSAEAATAHDPKGGSENPE